MKLLDKTRIIRFIRINHVKLVLTHVFVTQFPWDTILLIYIYSIYNIYFDLPREDYFKALLVATIEHL